MTKTYGIMMKMVLFHDEVFLEGYKDNERMPTLEEALEIVENNGYEIDIIPK